MRRCMQGKYKNGRLLLSSWFLRRYRTNLQRLGSGPAGLNTARASKRTALKPTYGCKALPSLRSEGDAWRREMTGESCHSDVTVCCLSKTDLRAFGKKSASETRRDILCSTKLPHSPPFQASCSSPSAATPASSFLAQCGVMCQLPSRHDTPR